MVTEASKNFGRTSASASYIDSMLCKLPHLLRCLLQRIWSYNDKSDIKDKQVDYFHSCHVSVVLNMPRVEFRSSLTTLIPSLVR
jgi:hypothetical protein